MVIPPERSLYDACGSRLFLFGMICVSERVGKCRKLFFVIVTYFLVFISDDNYCDNFSGWNMKVCVVIAVSQLLIWSIWAGISHHPSRWKLWTVVIGGGLAMLLEIYDFPPYQGLVDSHALWHATTIPLTYMWWSFIKDDAKFGTSNLSKKDK